MVNWYFGYFLIAVSAFAVNIPVSAQGSKVSSGLKKITLPGGIPMEFVWIDSGSFIMGSPESEYGRGLDEGPQRRVRISKPFYLGRFEVTQAQWKALMVSNPSPFRLMPDADQLPADMVSWHGAQSYVSALNGLGLGRFRLPTEAEWEYACRAGTTTAYYWGNDATQATVSKYAWGYSRAEGRSRRVGTLLPNPWGLYDMCGNVWEWCGDWLGTYLDADTTDPKGPLEGERKAYRGGSWYNEPEALRSANRHGHPPVGNGGLNSGLRVVLETD